jgi:Flp pilus assembly protein TadB
MEKMTKTQKEVLATLFFVALIITAVIKFFQNVGLLPLIIVIVACVLAVYLYRAIKKKKRLRYLEQKYVNKKKVEKIINREIWQGETADQLIDSIGNPEVVDDKNLKTQKKAVWKYGRRGSKGYNLIVNLEKGIVVNWEGKV